MTVAKNIGMHVLCHSPMFLPLSPFISDRRWAKRMSETRGDYPWRRKPLAGLSATDLNGVRPYLGITPPFHEADATSGRSARRLRSQRPRFVIVAVCLRQTKGRSARRRRAATMASLKKPIRLRHYLLLTTTVGSLGIVIGALEASFEQQHHFRHVVFVDEEV